MPLHDWTRVDAGIFHHFHNAWIADMARLLNNGLLPEEYYALGEQVTTGGNPDVLTLRDVYHAGNGSAGGNAAAGIGGTGLLTAPPATRLVARVEEFRYTALQREIAVRHVTDDTVVALIEIVSSGNKAAVRPYRTFLDKVLGAIQLGVHLLVLDLYPPTRRDPNGIHGSVWGELMGEEYVAPADADRTLAAYSAGPVKTAYVEPVALGSVLREMPLFLTVDGVGYVNVPLEATYRATFDGLPRKYRRILGG